MPLDHPLAAAPKRAEQPRPASIWGGGAQAQWPLPHAARGAPAAAPAQSAQPREEKKRPDIRFLSAFPWTQESPRNSKLRFHLIARFSGPIYYSSGAGSGGTGFWYERAATAPD
jgi:hypothetical protein